MAKWNQWRTAFTVCLTTLLTGLSRGWTSPYTAQLTAEDSTHPLRLNPHEAAWIASLLFLGRTGGVALGAVMQSFIGRKRTIWLNGVPCALGWTFIIIAPSVLWLYAGRFLSGVATGIVHSSVVTFMAEIADRNIRGALILVLASATATGVFLGNVMGSYLSMENFSYVTLVITLTFMALFFFVPESPYDYLAKKNPKAAEESLVWYSQTEDVKEELYKLEEFIGENSMAFRTQLEEIKKPEHRRNLMLMFLFNVFSFWCGQNVITAYAEIILTKSKVAFEPDVVVMVTSLLTIFVIYGESALIDYFGRRNVLMSMGAGLCFAHTLLGLQFQLLSMGVDPSVISWLPFFADVLICACLSAGIASVPIVLLGELFPPALKNIACLWYYALNSLVAFAAVRVYPPYADLVGEKFVFWTFALGALASVIYTYFFVPETKKLSLIEIQEKNVAKNRRRF